MNEKHSIEVKHHAGLDQRMEKAVRGIRLLESVSWQQDVQQQFLADWRSGKKKLPAVVYQAEQHTAARVELESIAKAADLGHPLGRYVQRTANSWITATHLLEARGTSAVTEHSIKLFGRPGDALPGNGPTNIVAAQHFIFLANELDSELSQIEPEYCLSAEIVQTELQEALDKFFTHHKITVELDPNLIAKAAAGPTRESPARRQAGAGLDTIDGSAQRPETAHDHPRPLRTRQPPGAPGGPPRGRHEAQRLAVHRGSRR